MQRWIAASRPSRGSGADVMIFKFYVRGDGVFFKSGNIPGVRTLAGYADTSKHGRVRFAIALTSNDGAMRFRLHQAIQSGL